MTEISDRYERLAEGFTERVAAVPPDDPRWQQQSPCEDWKAIDVVRHVLDGHHTFFGLIEQELPGSPSVDDDPLGAWTSTRDATIAALQDPAIAGTHYTGQMGEAVWEQSIDQFMTGDVLVHTWDLSRALGLDDTVPADELVKMQRAFEPMGDAIRQPGAFGPAVEVGDDASPAERALAFLGRDPGWRLP